MASEEAVTAMRTRAKPFIWPTWITGIISGDKQCRWAPWFRAHYQDYEKIDDADNTLTQWRADHAAMVARRVDELRTQGWQVTVEAQNKFWVKGETTDVCGQPDIIAARDDAVRVEDCKTGQARESDYWQVVTYVMALTLPRGRLVGRQVSGAVVYRDRIRHVSAQDVAAGKMTVVATIREIAGPAELPHTPSGAECRRCDIAACTERAVEQPDEKVSTTEF